MESFLNEEACKIWQPNVLDELCASFFMLLMMMKNVIVNVPELRKHVIGSGK